MTPSFEARLKAICNRLNVELRLDERGDPDVNMLAHIGLSLLKRQPEFQPEWTGRAANRPKGSVQRRPEDLKAVRFIEDAAKQLGVDFPAVLRRAVPFLEDRGWLPVPEHGGDRTTNRKRIKRLKTALDADRAARTARLSTPEGRRALAKALLAKPGQ